jgi:hypothetical protein
MTVFSTGSRPSLPPTIHTLSQLTILKGVPFLVIEGERERGETYATTTTLIDLFIDLQGVNSITALLYKLLKGIVAFYV